MCLTNHQGLFHVSDFFWKNVLNDFMKVTILQRSLAKINFWKCMSTVAVISKDLVSWLLNFAKIIVIAG